MERVSACTNGFEIATYLNLASDLRYSKTWRLVQLSIHMLTQGAFSGVTGALFGSPLYLVKTQLQAAAANNVAVGFQVH
jgi:solute carrier family 25 protein 34/35